MIRNGNKVKLSDYLQVIWKRRLMVAFFAFLAAFITAIISLFFMRPIYRSHATIIVYPEKSSLLGADIGAATDLSSLAGFKAPTSIDLELSVMTSTDIVGNVVDRLNLLVDRKDIPVDYLGQQIISSISTNDTAKDGIYHLEYTDDQGDFKVYYKEKGLNLSFGKGMLVGSGNNCEAFYGGGLTFTLSDPAPQKGKVIKFEVRNRDKLINWLILEKLRIYESSQNTVEIIANYYDPIIAQSIITVLLDTYIESNYSYQQMAANESLRLIGERMNEVKRERDNLQEKITKFQQEHSIFYMGEEDTALQRQVAELKVAQTTADIQKNTITFLLEKAESDSAISPEILASLIPLLYNSQSTTNTMLDNYDTIIYNLETARSTYTEESPMVKEQADLVKRIKQDISDRVIKTLKLNANALDSQLNKMQSIYTNMVQKLPPDTAELYSMVNSYKDLSAVYSALLVQYETERVKEIQEKSRYAKVRVVSPPSLNLKPTSPRKKINVILAFIGGAFFGLLVAIFIEFIDYTPFERKHPRIMAVVRFPGNVWRGFWRLFRRRK
jgi:uncharacterized protein involved in exopolysaccharide biosynthesis